MGRTVTDCAIMMQAFLNKHNFSNLNAKLYPRDFFYSPRPFSMNEYEKKHK